MRIIFKILAAPFVLVLTLLVAVLSFLLSLSAGLLSVLASVLGLLSVLMLFVEKDISTGIAGLLMAFAISPFGLPALAGWLLAKLDELNGSLRGFIMGGVLVTVARRCIKRRLIPATVCRMERRDAYGHNLPQIPQAGR